MTPKRIPRSLPTLMLFLSVTTAFSSQAAERIILDHATIVTASDESSFVRYGVEDLAGYLKGLTGNDVPVIASPDRGKGVKIVVGTKTVQLLFPGALPSEKLGNEGYLLRSLSKDGAEYVIVAGVTPRGTKIALAALMKKIRAEGKSTFVSAPLDLLAKPAFAKRGMHLNGWAIHYPYSFRSWREEDWHRYLDILSYQGVNLLYLWPFIEIMPVPLSPEDEAYLRECRRVVDYAQKKHGMEVWIMQCTNRVAKDRCGVTDPRHRPYWRPSQQDLNPGNSEHFKAIMASREALYRIVNNADGVCNIDSDPGFFKGSPLSDYMNVLRGCRALLDRHNIHGKQTLLINWMLWGWGRAERFQSEGLAQHQRRTIENLKHELPEPWGLISSQFGFLPPGQYQFLPICRELGVLQKTVFLPYGIIEFEPSYPKTNVRIAKIRGTFDHQIAEFPGLAGVMGNVQTPLLQFPNVYFFTSTMLELDYRTRSEPEVLRDLSGHLYPEHKLLLADCFLAMKETDPAKVDMLADRLTDIVREDKLGRLGVFARKLFPDHRIVANSLILQLRLRAAHGKLLQGLTPTTSKADCEKLLCDCLDAYLAWDTAHGWHGLWGWKKWPLAAFPYSALADRLRKYLGSDSEVDAFFKQVTRRLSAKYDTEVVREGCVYPLEESRACGSPEENRGEVKRAGKTGGTVCFKLRHCLRISSNIQNNHPKENAMPNARMPANAIFLIGLLFSSVASADTADEAWSRLVGPEMPHKSRVCVR